MSTTPNISSAASNLQKQSESLANIEEGRVQTLTNITDLQNIEKDYMNKVSTG